MSNRNIIMANTNNYFTNVNECGISLSNTTFKYDTMIPRYLSHVQSTAPLLSMILHKQTNIDHESVSSVIIAEGQLSKIERNKLYNEKESQNNVNNFKRNSEQWVHEVKTATETAYHCSSDDTRLFSTKEDTVTEILYTASVGKDFHDIRRKYSETSSVELLKTEANKKNALNCCCEQENLDTLQKLDLDKQSTQALLDVNTALRSTPVTTVTGFSTNQATLPCQSHIHEVSHWYIVMDKLGMKEKLTQRQLLQMTGMMILGFIFVALIIVWVFSPILF